jgi:hydroxymethylpyrimidine pyrophosphatase-like HAD family hydrolase
VRLLSVDFDSTLVRDWEHPVFCEELGPTLGKLRIAGVAFAINTGRTLLSVEQGLEETRFPVRPDFALTAEREVFLWRDGAWHDFGDWNRRCQNDHERLFQGAKDLLDRIECFVETKTGARLYFEADRFTGIVARTNREMDEISAFIDDERASLPAFGYQRNSVYLRFCHSAYHKGAALAELQRLTGITPDETFAIGDNFNDLPMLLRSVARYVACPSNAVDSVKAAVQEADGYIASADTSLGVVEALRFFFPRICL